MRLGIVGDTHLRSRRLFGKYWDRWISDETGLAPLCDALAKAWGDIDAIWHTGDVAGPEVLEGLKEYFTCPVVAVRGNADKGRFGRELPELHQQTIHGKRVAMIHGWGTQRFIVDRIARRISWTWDAVVFGHTHAPLCHQFESVLWVNPGSATDIRFAGNRSAAKLVIQPDNIAAELIDLEPHLT